MSETLRSTVEEEVPVETINEQLPEGLADRLRGYAGDGTLALAFGAFGFLRGLRTLRSNPVGGVLGLLWGAAWIAVGLTQRRSAGSEGATEEEAGFDDLGEVTPGETEDDIAAKNTLPPTDVGQPQAQDVGLSDEAETTNEPADVAGPQDEHAAPKQDKTTVPGETPDDVTMIGDDDSQINDEERSVGDEDDEEHGGGAETV